jgi:hypothetical protein
VREMRGRGNGEGDPVGFREITNCAAGCSFVFIHAPPPLSPSPTPFKGWGSVKPGDIGAVVSFDKAQGRMKVDFNAQKGWIGLEKEMEAVRSVSFDAPSAPASVVTVGARVRVKHAIDSPTTGWGRAGHGMVGTVKSVDDAAGRCRVDFATHPDWVAVTSELEVVPDDVDERPLVLGASVRVRAGIVPSSVSSSVVR